MALGTLLSVKINKAILITSPFGAAKRGETQGVASDTGSITSSFFNSSI